MREKDEPPEEAGSDAREETENQHAVEKQISGVTGREPWVSVIGTVISRSTNESTIVLDDGTGQMEVRVTRLPELGGLIRVIGRPLDQDGKIVLDGLIVQDFSGFDVELYRRIRELEARIFSQEGDYPQ